MTNLQLFDLINAAPGLGDLPRGIAVFIGNWLSDLIGIALAVAFVRGSAVRRLDIIEMVTALLLALALAHLVGRLWPQPRPFMLGLGTQYLAHGNGPGLPSHHVTSLWSLALAALATRRMTTWGVVLLAAGVLVGWTRVFLGVHFPYDVLAAFPVASLGAFAAFVLRALIDGRFARMMDRRRPSAAAANSVRYEA